MLFAALLLCAIARLGSAASSAAHFDVCVVGAGPAGVAATQTLIEKGKRVALLEREAFVGGQTAPKYVDPSSGFRVLMGAIVFTPGDYPNTMRYAQMVGLGIQPYFKPDSTYVFAGGDSSPIPLPASPNGTMSMPGLQNLPGLGDAFKRYAEHYKRLTPTLRLLGGLPVILKADPGLSAPMDRWMADIGAAALLPIAAQVMLQTGYQHLSQTTAASCLLYLTPLNMLSILGEDFLRNVAGQDPGSYPPEAYAFTDDVGFAEVLQRMSTRWPAGTVRTSVSIMSVLRPSPSEAGAVSITYSQPGGGSTTLRCGKLLNAVGQTAFGLSYLGMDDVEKALFARVSYTRYFTTALLVSPKLPTGGWLFVLPPPDSGDNLRLALSHGLVGGGPGGDKNVSDGPRPARPLIAALTDPQPFKGDVTSYIGVNYGAASRPTGVPLSADPGLLVAYSLSDVPITAQEVAAKAARTISGRTRKAIVRKVYEHIYHPRPSVSDVQGGWYQRLDDIQGRRGTYHCGGMLTFWDVEQAMRSGIEAAQRFF